MDTVANSIEITINKEETPHFPKEGVCIGSLNSIKAVFPALIDLFGNRGTCFLYDSSDNRRKVNNCLERIAWRMALSLPFGSCEFLIYNGGTPGENFNSLNRLPKSFFKSSQKVLFDADSEEFTRKLSDIYRDLATRQFAIKDSGKNDVSEMDENEVADAKLKYTFVFISDFPRVTTEQRKLVSKLVTANCQQSGVFVFLSWDMNAKWTDDIDYQALLDNMTLLFPKNNRYYFKNSGHDELLNKFMLKLDSEIVDSKAQELFAHRIASQIEEAEKRNKQDVLIQDFANIESSPYEPVMSEISVTVGLDIEDKREATLRFNSVDHLHAFILGQSGSGKSVLLNNIITTAILKYSPQDLMLYLMDFKGVEFNSYCGIKHAKAILVDNSDPQMTLEVLRELKDENKRREKLFREKTVKNIDVYNRKFPNNHLPQILFVADECQVLFQMPENATQRIIQNEISNILNTIATQGRSQGIHMLLATQQLDGTDIPGPVLKNLTDCFLLMSAPSDSELLVPDSSIITSKQPTGIACYYHKKELQSRVQTYYANEDELKAAIQMAHNKALSFDSNGAAYFSGSAVFTLAKDCFADFAKTNCPIALVGKSIKLSGETTAITLRDDYNENILFFGANSQGQTTGVLLSALASLIYSYKRMEKPCEFLVIDCYQDANSYYKKILQAWNEKGLCHIIERTKSGHTLAAIAEDIRNECARPVVLAIIGSERYIEMKRNLPIETELNGTLEATDDNGGIEPISIDIDLPDPFNTNQSQNKKPDNTNQSQYKKPEKFQSVLTYILEEGSIQGVHVLLQVDKPGNILFEGDYGTNATDKFQHKIILKSENKFLAPMRFSQDIDVDSLSDDEEHLRAYYYPEGGNPQLFTPFTLNDSIEKLLK